MSWRAWLGRLSRRPTATPSPRGQDDGRRSILRELLSEETLDEIRRQDLSPTGRLDLYDTAMLVQRAGLVHLVGVATRTEAVVLARTAERIADERRADLADKLRHPARALAPYDDGRALEDEALDKLEAIARARTGGL